MLFETIIVLGAFTTIVLIFLAATNRGLWDDSQWPFPITGIVAVLFITWYFLSSAEFAIPGHNEFWFIFGCLALVTLAFSCTAGYIYLDRERANRLDRRLAAIEGRQR